jgi:hypothetical protein
MKTNLTEKKISEMNELATLDKIDLSPAYQRRPVWSIKAKTYLIDTILNGLPIPKFFLLVKVDPINGETKHDVVDGQQRLTAIFDFIKGELANGAPFILKKKNHPKPETFNDEFEDLTFKTLPADLKSEFWKYRLTLEEFESGTDADIRDMFVRLNLSGEKLNGQELRHAAYDGDFKQLVYDLSDEFVDDLVSNKIITASAVKRMGDAEFISELLTSQMRGIQDKKKILDNIYRDHDAMDDDDIHDKKNQFRKVFNLIEKIFDEDIKTTRFSKKTDYYSLFCVMHRLTIDESRKIPASNNSGLKEMLIRLNNVITKDATEPKIRAYYDSVTNAGDAIANRRLRDDYLYSLIKPFAITRDPSRSFSTDERNLMWHSNPDKECAICGKVIESYDEYDLDHKDAWDNGGATTLENAQIAHSSCNRSKGSK